MQYIVIGNFGNHSLAVMQALIEKNLTNLHFIYVDTGWAASSWPERIANCMTYARSQHVKVHLIKAKSGFAEMVNDRSQFPNHKFQWCSSFLKGLTILEHLDEIDPSCEAQIVLGKRQQDSRRYSDLQEFDFDSELYQGRVIWHPLWQTTDECFFNLIKNTGFSLLPHQSLECSPCIYNDSNTLKQLDPLSIARLAKLEQSLDQTMFPEPIHFYSSSKAIANEKGLHLHPFDRGCGSAWGCGE